MCATLPARCSFRGPPNDSQTVSRALEDELHEANCSSGDGRWCSVVTHMYHSIHCGVKLSLYDTPGYSSMILIFMGYLLLSVSYFHLFLYCFSARTRVPTCMPLQGYVAPLSSRPGAPSGIWWYMTQFVLKRVMYNRFPPPVSRSPASQRAPAPAVEL